MSKKKSVFKPKPGQVDFTHARFAPVINCVLRYRGKLLVVKRSESLNFYPGVWNGISGFLDDAKTLEEKITEELHEELGLPKTSIKRIRLGEIFHQDEPKYKKIWIVHPLLVDVTTNKVTLDWEAKEYAWLTEKGIKHLTLLPGFEAVLKRLRRWL